MTPELSLAIIAICFVLLFVCALILTVSLFFLFRKIRQIVDLNVEPIVRGAKEITANVKESTDSIFKSVSRMGKTMETDSTERPKQPVNANDWVEWLGLGIILWQKIKKRIDK